MSAFLERLRAGVFLGDGAMGSMLINALSRPWSALEELNLSRPEKIIAIHQAYVAAGARVIETNTFGGNRIRLARANLADQVRMLNVHGAALARAAAGSQVLVGGAIGPTGGLLEPRGDLSFAEVRDVFAEQVAALAEGGADLIVVETMSALEEARAALAGVRAVTDLPVVCTMTFELNHRTMMGVTPEHAARALLDWGADVIGANCGYGPRPTEEVIRRMHAECPEALLAVQPSAGLPRLVGGTAVYDIGTQEYAAYARRFAALGVRFLGACCGSTPAYTAALAALESTWGVAVDEVEASSD